MEGNRAKVLYPNIVIFQYAPVDVLFVCYNVEVLAFSCFSFNVLVLLECCKLLAALSFVLSCHGTGSTCGMQIARCWPSKPLCSQ